MWCAFIVFELIFHFSLLQDRFAETDQKDNRILQLSAQLLLELV